MSSSANRFVPDYAIPPGETLQDTLAAIGMTQADLAERTGRPKKMINEIIKGKAPITPETALQLERVLNVPAKFWNNLETGYRETMARLAERESLQSQTVWLKNIPLKTMIARNWIKSYKDKVEQLQEVLSYFGVASPEQWQEIWGGRQVAFRESAIFKSDPGAVSAWLRKGELVAREMACKTFDQASFKAALQEVRKLTITSPDIFQPEMTKLCAEAGVAVVFVPELQKMRTSGATWWLTPSKAVIMLTLRHKSDDQLWFSFFHEAAHILLHGKKDMFIEEDGKGDKEEEANQFAADFLIPAKNLLGFLNSTRLSKEAISKFANEIGVAPGIVVGRLQHDKKLPHTHCNDLKMRLEWGC